MANRGERRPSFWDTRLAESNPFDTTDNEKDKAVLGDVEIAERIRQGSVPEIHGEAEALAIARKGGWEIEALMTQMEMERVEQNAKQGFFDLNFKNPKHFTWLLVGFASMGGLLSGLDQSLISGANLYMPKDLGLTVQQNSLVNSGCVLVFLHSYCRRFGIPEITFLPASSPLLLLVKYSWYWSILKKQC
jgi:hypothetical protein